MRHIRRRGYAAPKPGRLPGWPHSAVSGDDRRPDGQLSPSVVTVRDQAVARLSVLIFTIAACPDQRLPPAPGSPCAAGPPSTRPNRPAGRASARSAADRPGSGTPVATTSPSTTAPARGSRPPPPPPPPTRATAPPSRSTYRA